MTTPEFSRLVPLDRLGERGHRESIAADMAERAALCARFGWLALDRLEADAELVRKATGIEAHGTLRATLAQPCVVTGDPVPAQFDTAFALRFVEEALLAEGPDEIELAEDELDVVPFSGGAVDLGEAVAQTVALVADPYPRSARADAAMASMGAEEAGPFAGLKDLLKR